MTCAPSKDSDQPGHPPSLIRVFAVHIKKAWVFSYPLNAQRRLWSDWADAQADLSLLWAHMPLCWFRHEAAFTLWVSKAAFPRAKFLCHISHALQSLLTYFCGIVTVNLYWKTDTDEKWINNSYNFDINDCRACNLWQRKFGRVLEP